MPRSKTHLPQIHEVESSVSHRVSGGKMKNGNARTTFQPDYAQQEINFLTNRGVPQVLTPETILQAQRLFGNRAVSRQLAEQRQMKAVLPGSGFPETPAAAASIQRLLSVKDYRKKVKSDEAQQKDLESIAGALGDYHAIKSKTDPTCQQRLAALQALDRLIYAWFNKYVTETIAQVPNGLFFQTLLD